MVTMWRPLDWRMAQAMHHGGRVTYAYAPLTSVKLLKDEHQEACGAFCISEEKNLWPMA